MEICLLLLGQQLFNHRIWRYGDVVLPSKCRLLCARRVTQLASLVVHALGFSGIYYRSRYAHNFENWALFEPFRIRDTASRPIAKNDPALREAVRILGLTLV